MQDRSGAERPVPRSSALPARTRSRASARARRLRRAGAGASCRVHRQHRRPRARGGREHGRADVGAHGRRRSFALTRRSRREAPVATSHDRARPGRTGAGRSTLAVTLRGVGRRQASRRLAMQSKPALTQSAPAVCCRNPVDRRVLRLGRRCADRNRDAAAAEPQTRPRRGRCRDADRSRRERRGRRAASPCSAPGEEPPPVYRTQLPPSVTLHYQVRRGVLRGTGTIRWAGRAATAIVSRSKRRSAGSRCSGRPARATSTRTAWRPSASSTSVRAGPRVAANFRRDDGRITFSGTASSGRCCPAARTGSAG